MRKVALLLLMGLTAQAFASKQHGAEKLVTVEQLEQTLSADHNKDDKDLAGLLYGMKLTERLSAARLAHDEAELPGPVSRKTLTVLSDEAGFLDLPAGDIPADAPPDTATQVSFLNRAVGYLTKTIYKLPNFYATRETIRFQMYPGDMVSFFGQSIPGYPLFPVGGSNVTVLYRDGKELLEDKAEKNGKKDSNRFQLRTNGEFGPILATVLVDAVAHGKVRWGHWEKGAAGPMAVFRYTVSKDASHYTVSYPGPKKEMQMVPAYHGEIAVNPVDGSILRLTMLADFGPDDLPVKADLLVEYGPTEIGAKSYICPVKSVALSEVRISNSGFFSSNSSRDYSGSVQMRINDVRFTQYHLFRAEVRILSGNGTEPEGAPSTPSPANAPSPAPATAHQP